jgi:hypothetical protein
MSNPPNVMAWLEIPDDCRFTVEYTGDGDLHFMIGTRHDGVDLLFEPEALLRFVALATEALAQPEPASPKVDRPRLASPVV